MCFGRSIYVRRRRQFLFGIHPFGAPRTPICRHLFIPQQQWSVSFAEKLLLPFMRKMCPAKNVKIYSLERKYSLPEAVEVIGLPGQSSSHLKLANDDSPKKRAPPANNCLFASKMRIYSVVLSIGAGSMFLVSLDSVVDNLIPVAMHHLVGVYGSEAMASIAWSWVVSSRAFGLAFGCFCAFLLSNCHSRKWPLVAAFAINFVGGLLSMLICTPNAGVALACTGRFMSGIGSGMAQVIGSVMLAEIPPVRLRGTCLATMTGWACIGELAGLFLSLDSVLGTPQLWHVALGSPVLIIPFALVFLVTAPDSPRILLIAGREEQAFEAIQFYQKSEDWIPSLRELRAEIVPKENAGADLLQQLSTVISTEDRAPLVTREAKRNPKSVLNRYATGKFVRPLLLGTFVLTFAHLDDWLWISYSTQAFENAGMPSSEAQRASLWMAFPQAIVSLALLCCFEGFSRRQLIILPTLGSIGCALVAVWTLNNENEGHHLFGGKVLPLIAALDLCTAAVASESAYSVVPELFPQNYRLMGTALIGIAQNMFGGFLTTLALPLMNAAGTEWVLVPFALLNVLYVAVVHKWLPETGGKSFCEISECFSDRLPECAYLLDYVKSLPRYFLVLSKRFLLQFVAVIRF